jgi:hypothetical protein
MQKDIFFATVIDNNSQNSPSGLKNGSIQFRISELMDGITNDSDLPWALPDNTSFGGSDEYGESKIPEIGSLIWIYFEDFLKKKAFYLNGINLKNFGPHSLFEDNVKSNITGFSSSYPDIKYTYYKNGICIGVSSNDSTPEIFIYHPEGAYIFIKSTGEIQLKGNTGALEKMLLTESFMTLFTPLITSLKGISVSTFGPIITAATLLEAQLTPINNLISQSVKNS